MRPRTVVEGLQLHVEEIAKCLLDEGKLPKKKYLPTILCELFPLFYVRFDEDDLYKPLPWDANPSKGVKKWVRKKVFRKTYGLKEPITPEGIKKALKNLILSNEFKIAGEVLASEDSDRWF